VGYISWKKRIWNINIESMSYQDKPQIVRSMWDEAFRSGAAKAHKRA
jgi:hypothetical protein